MSSSIVNTHTFFCIEPTCGAEAYVSGGRCDDCFEAYIGALRLEHNPPRCERCSGFGGGLAPSESGRFCGRWCEAGYLLDHVCGGASMRAIGACVCDECIGCYAEHKCSGEFDHVRGCYVCDDADDPRCPSNIQEPPCGCAPSGTDCWAGHSVDADERCGRCDLRKGHAKNGSGTWTWYCQPCADKRDS